MINLLKIISVVYLSVLAIINITGCESDKKDKDVQAGISAGQEAGVQIAGVPISGQSAGEVAGSIIIGDMSISGIEDSGMIAGEETTIIAGEEAGTPAGQQAGAQGGSN